MISKSIISGEVAKLFADAGIICIASLISPYRKDRDACRALMPEGDFIEVCGSLWENLDYEGVGWTFFIQVLNQAEHSWSPAMN